MNREKSPIEEVTNTVTRDDLLSKYKVFDVKHSRLVPVVQVSQSIYNEKNISILVDLPKTETDGEDMTLVTNMANDNDFIVLKDKGKKHRNGEPIFEAQGKRIFTIYCVWHDGVEGQELAGIFSDVNNAREFIDANWEDWNNWCSIEAQILDGTNQKSVKIFSWNILKDENGNKQCSLEFDFPHEKLRKGFRENQTIKGM